MYVGFGSLVVGDPAGLTAMIVEAARQAGVRVLIAKVGGRAEEACFWRLCLDLLHHPTHASQGWGGLGQGLPDPAPEGVLVLGSDTPHDWLLPRCSAVVHHGGAGTTAAGILASCPSTVVPFFGDQFFW